MRCLFIASILFICYALGFHWWQYAVVALALWFLLCA